MLFILLIILYFSVVGALFYKLFISTPSEQEVVKESVAEPVQILENEFEQEPVISKLNSYEAADINVG